MKGLLALVLAVAAVASAEEINSSNFGELSSGCWLLRFHATWCAACSSTAVEWTAAQQEKALRLGCRFGEVNVDDNMALSETFGVRTIPSFFVVQPQRGLCRFETQDRFSAERFVEFFNECSSGARGWESGVWRDPLSWLWRPLVRVGYLAEDAHRLMQRKGLSTTQEIVAASAAVMAFLLVWGSAVYAVLRCCCGAVDGGRAPEGRKKPKRD